MKICRLTMALGTLMFVGATAVQADPTVDIYSGFVASGGGAPFSGLVGSFSSPDILFATDFGYSWHPFGLASFGADITGTLDVAAGGIYTFTLNSDDGSLLFIDGALAVDNGGAHGPTIVSSAIALAAGSHSFEVQFFEDFGGASGVDLYLPAGVTYGAAAVPEPSSALFLGTALFGSFTFLRRKVRKRA